MTYVLDEVHTTQTVMTNKAHAVPKMSFFGHERVFWGQRSKFWREIAIFLVCADIRVFGYVKWLLLRQTSILVKNRIGKLVMKKSNSTQYPLDFYDYQSTCGANNQRRTNLYTTILILGSSFISLLPTYLPSVPHMIFDVNLLRSGYTSFLL